MFERRLKVGEAIQFGIPLLLVLDIGSQDKDVRPRLVFIMGVFRDFVPDVVDEPEEVFSCESVEIFLRVGKKFFVGVDQLTARHRDGGHFLFEFALLFSPCADEAYNYQNDDDSEEDNVTGHFLLFL